MNNVCIGGLNIPVITHSEIEIYISGIHVDSVFYSANMDLEEVRKSLIEHDGYQSDIEVKRI